MANAPLAVVEAIVGHTNPSMTRHYTHVSETAAENAIAALPSVTPQVPDEVKKHDRSAPDHQQTLTSIRDILDGLSGNNWEQVKRDVLAILVAAPLTQ